MPEQSNDYRVVVFGAAGVGKSSLVTRFIRGKCLILLHPSIRKFHNNDFVKLSLIDVRKVNFVYDFQYCNTFLT
jgi:GTPase SAR1 family protein